MLKIMLSINRSRNPNVLLYQIKKIQTVPAAYFTNVYKRKQHLIYDI